MRVALPSRKNLQPATIATRPTANDGAYEPVRSYTNPASAGPSPAPLRQPSPTTLMIVASAASPNASGTAFTIVLSAPAPPRPKTTSVTGTAQAGRPATNATNAARQPKRPISQAASGPAVSQPRLKPLSTMASAIPRRVANQRATVAAEST